MFSDPKGIELGTTGMLSVHSTLSLHQIIITQVKYAIITIYLGVISNSWVDMCYDSSVCEDFLKTCTRINQAKESTKRHGGKNMDEPKCSLALISAN